LTCRYSRTGNSINKFPPVWQQIELTPVLALREPLDRERDGIAARRRRCEIHRKPKQLLTAIEVDGATVG